MRLMRQMADRIRHSIRSFLQIEPAQSNMIQLRETMDFNTNVIRNQIWYRGDAEELSQFYKSVQGEENRNGFWSSVPTVGRSIRKIHTGLPAMIADVLTSIVIADMNGIRVDDGVQETWKLIEKDNDFMKVMEEAITSTMVDGDGAFRISFDSELSEYPIIEFISGDSVDIHYKRGRVYEIIFKTMYFRDYKRYVLEEVYGYGYINTKLYLEEKEVPLHTISDTKNIHESISFNDAFIMAVPLIIFKSGKWKGRGKSIFEGKTDNFDALDEAWSQWMDALRKGRAKEYIPSDMLPRNPYTGEVLKPNPFDNAYIEHEEGMGEKQQSKIEVIQPVIPHESYLATYITALDLCLQGLISPSTLGIDVKKLDNAEAQREKEKATLYTRNKIVEAIQNVIPVLVDSTIKAYYTMLKQPLKQIKVDVPFGEYANPSFESQVETVSKAKNGGIMSIEAAVEELYGDSKDDTWKKNEIQRLKEEQGIATESEPDIRDDMALLQNSSLIDNNQTLESKASTLNGAQIGSLLSIIQSYSTGAISRSAAISIVTSTLGISKENAEAFIEEQIKETPPSK